MIQRRGNWWRLALLVMDYPAEAERAGVNPAKDQRLGLAKITQDSKKFMVKIDDPFLSGIQFRTMVSPL